MNINLIQSRMASRGYSFLRHLGIATAISMSLAATSGAQTAPKPEPKSESKSDTVKPFYVIKQARISFTMPDDADNAAITMATQFPGAQPLPDSLYIKEEKHLRNIKQLTFDGENAEAYLSPDEKHVSFQARGARSTTCDQIFTMTLDGKNVKRVSTGKGHTTCSYYLPSGDKVLYSSTFTNYGGNCPPEPDRTKGYVWSLDPSYDIYLADTNGTLIKPLVEGPGYDAEATVSPVGDRIVFTSTRSGDIELYTMNIDGSDVKQLTNDEGYDGGAFFSQDGKQIVYRASRPIGEELKEYRELLKEGLIRPHSLEIYVMNADGSNKRQLTLNGAANFAPYFFPDGKHVIFSSNAADPKGRDFDLYVVSTDGNSSPERITYYSSFDGFPVFTKDGKHLILCSNRNGSNPHNTNVFIADWAN